MNGFRFTSAPARQRGISLLVVLILLLVMSVLGIAVLRSSAMQERMAANMYDRSRSFQAAEMALREAQSYLEEPDHDWLASPSLEEEDGCVDGRIHRGSTTGEVPDGCGHEIDWIDDGKPSPEPQYRIEYLGNVATCDPSDDPADAEKVNPPDPEDDPGRCPLYRVWAVAGGGDTGVAAVELLANVVGAGPGTGN